MKLRYLSTIAMFGLALGFEVSTNGASYGAPAYSKTVTLEAKSPAGNALMGQTKDIIHTHPESKVKPMPMKPLKPVPAPKSATAGKPAILGAPAPVGATPKLTCKPSPTRPC